MNDHGRTSHPTCQLPGMAFARLARLIPSALADCRLDLRGSVVLTEAATGAYVVTPILAALAGAKVLAMTTSTRYGTVSSVIEGTRALGRELGVEKAITFVGDKTQDVVSRADIITNSGHLRPLDRRTVDWMKPTAVVPLMFEAWEVQAGRVDVDLEAMHGRGIRVAGTNERHPAVDVFSYLGPMAVKLLHDAGLPVYRTRVSVLCDNPFRPYLEQGLRAVGAEVNSADRFDALLDGREPDVLLVAMRPTGSPVLDIQAVHRLAKEWPMAIVAQYWGDLDRHALHEAGVACWPTSPPRAGHMAVLPSAIGPDAIVRLQAGGLKVGAVLRKEPSHRTKEEMAFLDPV